MTDVLDGEIGPTGPTSDTFQYLNQSPGVGSDISRPRDSQGTDSASDISDLDRNASKARTRRRPGGVPTPIPARYAEVFSRYQFALSRAGSLLDPDTVRAYLSRVRQYLAWVDEATAGGLLEGDPLADTSARDWAARDYRAHLLTVRKRKPNTVNSYLTAIDDFNRRIGLGPADAKHIDLPNLAPRALDQRAQVRFLREAERAPARDRTMAYTAFYAGTRIHELVALDVDDVHISARKGVLIIRMGKNGKYREVNLHPQLRATFEAWQLERAQQTGDPAALFLNQRGGRLSARAATDILNGIASRAGIAVGRDEEFTTHVLRHTLGTTLARQKVDVVTIAELLGHSLETARRYTLPTEADRQAAIELLTVDE